MMETLIYFIPIFFFVLIAIVIVWQIVLTAEGQTRFATIATFLLWVLLTLLFCVFTLNYLIGPDCVFCYQPTHFSIAIKYSLGVVLYGVIGLGLLAVAKLGKSKSS